MATDTSKTPVAELPPDVFEALVGIWTEILVADYEARHGIGFQTKAVTPASRSSYDSPPSDAPAKGGHLRAEID
jgi:hypothetical protein